MRMVERTDEGTLAEAVDDLGLALVSRSLDDREIALRQQNRAFFQISGAGHEALLLGLARHLRAGYDWFFPYYRDRALALALGVTPERDAAAGGRRGRRPRVGRPADAVPLGRARPQHRQPDVVHREPVPARGRVRGSGALHQPPPAPARLRRVRRRAHVRVARRGRDVGRRVLGVAQHRVPPAPARCSSSWPTTATRSRCGRPTRHPAPISEMVRGIRGLRVVKMDGRDYFEVRRKGADAIAHVRAGAGPCLVHAFVTRPYSHSLSDDQKKYRGADELADEARARPDRRARAASSSRAACSRAEQVAAMRAEAKRDACAPRPRPRSRAASPRRRLGARPRRRAAAGHRRCRRTRRPTPTRRLVTFGEAIRLTLHEQMALDERIRVFGEDVADADPHVHRRSPGQGRRVRHHVRAAARVRRRPLLQHAARGGEHHRPRGRPGDARPAAVPRDPVLRLRVAGDEPAQVRGGHDALALERRVHVPDGRAHPDRRLPAGRRDLAQPVRRVDLRPRARAAHRVPVAGARRRRAPAHRVPVRRPGALPRAQAPLPPGLRPRPVAAGGLDAAVRHGHVRDARRARHGRHVGRDRAPRAARGAGARAPTPASRSSTCARSRRGTTTSSPSRCARPAACSWCTRTRSRAGSARRSPRSSPTSASSTSTRRCGGCAAPDTLVAYEPALEDAILPQVADIERDLEALLKY